MFVYTLEDIFTVIGIVMMILFVVIVGVLIMIDNIKIKLKKNKKEGK